MARPVKGVSALAFKIIKKADLINRSRIKKIIKKAVKIRLDRGETLDEIVESYTKLSQSQADEILEEFKDYKA